MKTQTTKKEIFVATRGLLVLFALFAASLLPVAAVAQTSVVSDPVGFLTTSCLMNSDTFVSVSFTRPPEFVGAIQSVAGSIITVTGTPGWSGNQFVYAGGPQPKHYYALIGSGGASNPKEGHTYFVSANGSNTLTVNATGDNLTGITANTQVLLIPYWTPATVFPAADANVSFTPTTSSAAYQTQVLVPNYSAPGINLPYLPAYFFSNNVDGTSSNVGWRIAGDNTTDHGDDPLLPDGYFVVRNLNGAPTLPLKSIGAVLTKKLTVPLVSALRQDKDNAVSMIRPVDVALSATGLNPANGSFLATPPAVASQGHTLVLKDQLLLFDNSQASINKQPSAIYYYLSGANATPGWKLVGDNLYHDTDAIPAGSAMVIRKVHNLTGQTRFWTNAPTY